MSERPTDPRLGRDRYERPNAGWVCGHAASGKGCSLGPDARGRCTASPDSTPCQPVPSLRRQRTRFAFWVTAACLGLLALALYRPDWPRWVSPGPLSPAHSALADTCSACHGAGGGDPSAACLKCHAALGEDPLRAHGVAVARLAQATARAQGRETSALGPVSSLTLAAVRVAAPSPEERIACAACHTEHRGAETRATRIDDRACRTCHLAAFESFTEGHPEFADDPGEPPGSAFDHARHAARFGEHATRAARFVGERGDLACRACHAEDPAGTMRPPGFAAACGACHHHGEQIRSAPALPFFRLPGVDVAALEERGLSIGTWPEDARGPDFDAGLTGAMRLLLSADPRLAADLETLDGARDSGVFLFDLYAADAAAAEAAARVAWAVKALLLDLVERREAALGERLGNAADPARIAALTGALPWDAPRAERQELFPGLEALRRRWLPRLAEDVAAWRAGRVSVRASVTPRRAAPAAPAATASAPAGDLDSLLEDDDVPPAAATPPADLDALLDDDTPAAVPPAPSRTTREPGGENRDRDAEWVLTGRFALDARDLSLGYRAASHADPFLRAWFELAASSDSHDAARNLLDELSDRDGGPGRCAKCHVVERSGPNRAPLRWHAGDAAHSDLKLVRFDHRPHLRPAGGDCATCHRMAAGETTPEATATANSGFGSIAREECAACHQRGRAPDGCLTCHRYHVAFNPDRG